MQTFTLNEDQLVLKKRLNKFLYSDETNFLILGPAGTGKTTVITDVLTEVSKDVCFCAFTNKATHVLEIMKSKHAPRIGKYDCSTIHVLLRLQPDFNNSEHSVRFQYDKEKAIGSFCSYDIIIFDECSTISNELYSWIVETASFINKNIKYIWLGDFWQLPPVGEESSIVFDESKTWRVARLTQIMRSRTGEMSSIYAALVAIIDKFRSNSITSTFLCTFPKNILPRVVRREYQEFINDYVKEIVNDPFASVVILSYSNKSVDEINLEVQQELDKYKVRNLKSSSHAVDLVGSTEGVVELIKHSLDYFAPGDRVYVDRPATISLIVEQGCIYRYKMMTDSISSIYSGEIYRVNEVINDIQIITNLQEKCPLVEPFLGQVLTIESIADRSVKRVFNIPLSQVISARTRMKKQFTHRTVIQTMVLFYDAYASFKRGYCMTLYKSQGSEWSTVYVNVDSIVYSNSGERNIEKKNRKTFSSIYTAISRARDRIVTQC